MVVRSLALIAVASGCDWTLGVRHFDHTPDADLDADYSKDMGMVHGTYRQHWVHNDATGRPKQEDTPPKISDLVMTVLLDDGMTRPVTYADGELHFTTRLANQHYALEVVSAYVDTIYESDATELALVDRFSGRIDRKPVLQPTPLRLAVTGQNVSHPTTKEELHTTGIWNQRPVLDFDGANTFSVDWSTIEGVGGPMALLDGASHDALYYAHYTGSGGVVRLDVSAPVANATIVDGGTNSFAATPATVNPTICEHLTSAIGAEVSRLDALHGSVGALQGWQVNSHPFDEFAASTRYPLAYALTANMLDMTVNFGNPYPVSPLDGEISIAVNAGSDGASITTNTIVPLDPGNCAAPPLTPIALVSVGIPDNVMLGARSLFAAGPAIAIDRSMPVTVSWTTTSGTADYYIVKVQEVLATSPLLLTHDALTIVTTQELVTFDAKHFTALPTYRIEIVAMTGYPEAASGDFSTIKLPITTATVDTVHFKTQ